MGVGGSGKRVERERGMDKNVYLKNLKRAQSHVNEVKKIKE